MVQKHEETLTDLLRDLKQLQLQTQVLLRMQQPGQTKSLLLMHLVTSILRKRSACLKVTGQLAQPTLCVIW